MPDRLPQPKSNKQKKSHLQHKRNTDRKVEQKRRAAEYEAARKLIVLPPKQRNVKNLVEAVFSDNERPDFTSPFQPLWDVLHPQSREGKNLINKAFKEYLKKTVMHLVGNRVKIFEAKGYRNSLQGPLKILINLVKFHELALRPIEEWKPRSHNTERQLSSLMRHLYAKYEVPSFMDKAWSADVESHQWWFLHIGSGQNIRTAPGLPVALTKKQAHQFLQAPKDFDILGAIRYGQLMVLGANEHICRQVLRTRVGTDFAHEEFWQSVFVWFLENPMLDTHQYAPIIDYLFNQKYVATRLDEHGVMTPEEPGLTMRGRDPATVLNRMEEWHKRAGRERGGKCSSWESSGIAGLFHEEGQNAAKKIFTVTELCTQSALNQEGRQMHHCVASYSWSCSKGVTSVWSMEEMGRDGQQKMLTLEVSNRERRIVQARGKYNSMPTQVDRRIMRIWADKAGLSISGWMI